MLIGYSPCSGASERRGPTGSAPDLEGADLRVVRSAPASVVWLALEAVGGVRVALPVEASDVRVGAKRPRPDGHAAFHTRGDDPLRSLTALHPAHQRAEHVEHLWSRAATAVEDTRSHEQAREPLHLV